MLAFIVAVSTGVTCRQSKVVRQRTKVKSGSWLLLPHNVRLKTSRAHKRWLLQTVVQCCDYEGNTSGVLYCCSRMQPSSADMLVKHYMSKVAPSFQIRVRTSWHWCCESASCHFIGGSSFHHRLESPRERVNALRKLLYIKDALWIPRNLKLLCLKTHQDVLAGTKMVSIFETTRDTNSVLYRYHLARLCF